LIPGFFVGGTGQKNLLVRAVGEKLAQFGVSGNLADPTLNVQRLSDSVSIAFNDDWPDAPNQTGMEAARAQVFAFEITPLVKDSSLLVSVPPGGYTATAAGTNQTTGVGLVEFYDTDPLGSTSTLTSISARAQVGTGGDILIPGIAIQGNVAMTILIRAVGPTLGGLGVAGTLDDPEMVLVRALSGGATEVVTSNDDWEQNPNVALLASATSQVFAFPLDSGSKDAALLVVLNPGVYTIQVSGKNGGTGVALVELYRVAPGL
jgi:hypothetical protein